MKKIKFSTGNLLTKLFVSFCTFSTFISLQAQIEFKDPLELPKSDKYTIQKVMCKSIEGKNIYGIAYIPNGERDTKYPTVIFSHGYSSSHMFHYRYGCALAENGIACYCFDFCGGSNISKSDGKTTDMSVLTEKRELEAVLITAKTWQFTDTSNIFLCGESQGGFVTALTAVDHEKEIKGLVLLYPAFHIPDAMRAKFPIKDSIKNVMDFPFNMKVGRCYVDAVYDMDAFAVTKNFNKRVLIIHGDCDRAVNVSYAERAAKSYPFADLKIIKGADHGFAVKEYKDLAIKYMSEFLQKESSLKSTTFSSILGQQ